MSSSGDEPARRRFEQVFRTHGDEVYSFALHRLDRDRARDIVSETFLVAWRRLDAVSDPALPWLLGTARNLIANELRRGSRQVALLDRLAAERGRAPIDEGPSDDLYDVAAAMDRLSARDREILVLAAWHELSSREAAQVLGCSTAAYDVRLHRARRRLRKALDLARTGPPATARQE